MIIVLIVGDFVIGERVGRIQTRRAKVLKRTPLWIGWLFGAGFRLVLGIRALSGLRTTVAF